MLHEAYFVTLAESRSGIGAWLRFTRWQSDRFHPSYHAALWAVLTVPDHPAPIALRHELSYDTWHRTPEELRIDDARLTAHGTVGAIAVDDRHVAWELTWEGAHGDRLPDGEELFPYAWMYRAAWPATKLAAPIPATRCAGTIQLGDRTYAVTGAMTHVGHTWGTRMADAWAWAVVPGFAETAGHLEAVSVRYTCAKTLTPPLTIARLTVEGTVYAFDSPLRWLTQHTAWNTHGWDLVCRTRRHRLTLRIAAVPSRIVGVAYTDPFGGHRYCYNTVRADARLLVEERMGGRWRERRQLTCPRAVTYEHAAMTPDPTLSLSL
ncbi:MAG: hypothetical protein HY543_06310 [Deltaproteobacteria bacterium]|nr:hypothetical protein [Deltaproteobacteria bacterium]